MTEPTPAVLFRLLAFVVLSAVSCAVAVARESALITVPQPMAIEEAGLSVVPVVCLDWFAQSGLHSAIALITKKNVPPTNAPDGASDINIASTSGLVLNYTEEVPDQGIVVLNCRELKIPTSNSSITPVEVVSATLECLRQLEKSALDKMTIRGEFKETGQEELQAIVQRFIRARKDQPFWVRQG